MKRILFILTFLLIFSSCKDKGGCGDNCGKTADTSIHTASGKTKMTCKLTSPELQQRKTEVIAKLQEQVKARSELTNGYRFKFDGSEATLDMLTSFIKSERQCCDFFSFNLSIPDKEELWLDITGPDGVKDFIVSELEM